MGVYSEDRRCGTIGFHHHVEERFVVNPACDEEQEHNLKDFYVLCSRIYAVSEFQSVSDGLKKREKRKN